VRHADGQRGRAAGAAEQRFLADLPASAFICSTVTGKPSAVTFATVAAASPLTFMLR
jgi:hypothetical protein